MVTDSNIYPLARYLTSITGDDVQDSLDFCKDLLLTNFTQEGDYCKDYSSRLGESAPVTFIKKNLSDPFATIEYFEFLRKTDMTELLKASSIIHGDQQ
jgi:hypothetical protein